MGQFGTCEGFLRDRGPEWWYRKSVATPLAILMLQSHLVIASGSSNANSLRVVRSGAGLERVACIEGLEGVEHVWSLDLGDGYVIMIH